MLFASQSMALAASAPQYFSRAIVESGRTDIEVVAATDLGPVETNAHLLRYDSVPRRFPFDVVINSDTITAGTRPSR